MSLKSNRIRLNKFNATLVLYYFNWSGKISITLTCNTITIATEKMCKCVLKLLQLSLILSHVYVKYFQINSFN